MATEMAMPPLRESTIFWTATVIGESRQPKDRASSSVTAISGGKQWPWHAVARTGHIASACQARKLPLTRSSVMALILSPASFQMMIERHQDHEGHHRYGGEAARQDADGGKAVVETLELQHRALLRDRRDEAGEAERQAEKRLRRLLPLACRIRMTPSSSGMQESRITTAPARRFSPTGRASAGGGAGTQWWRRSPR
ncbi:hypothetical protein [Belnapia moabensis]|uniref:hypothetical protein n=1 Tax=Belnapia moabensis TaxID=365533 RepID=UPI0005BB69C7|nr:hypothetical protein [Belnapia moabensis]